MSATLCCLLLTAICLEPFQADDKVPAGMDSALTSKDADYGYTKNKPIKVGSSEEYGGPKAEREYLDSLFDAQGKRIIARRIGSVGKGPDGNILDAYEISTSDGKKFQLYIDMYHPKNLPARQLAPKGLYKRKT